MTAWHKIEMAAATIVVGASAAACNSSEPPPIPTPEYQVDVEIQQDCERRQGINIRSDLGIFDPPASRLTLSIPEVFLIKSDGQSWETIFGQENLEVSSIQGLYSETFIIHDRRKSPERKYQMSVSKKYSDTTPIRFFFTSLCQKALVLLKSRAGGS